MRAFSAIMAFGVAALSVASVRQNYSPSVSSEGGPVSAFVGAMIGTAVVSAVDTPTMVTDTSWRPLLGSSLRYGVDTTVAPCDDFYQYVNGGWRKGVVFDTPAAKIRSVDFFKDVDLRTKLRLRHIMDSARSVAKTTTDLNLRVIAEFYTSCLTADSLDLRGRVPTSSKKDTTPKKDTSRADQCVDRSMAYMSEALGQIYAKELLANNAVPHMEKLLQAVRDAVRVRITKNPWMTADDKGAALERLDRLKLRVGVPTQSVDFSRLALTSNYQQNVRILQNFFQDSWYRSVGEDNRQNWKASLIQANAFYMEGEHAIEVPPTMFMAPFFDPTADDLYNFAGIGHVIGHEIFHSVAKSLPLLEGAELPNQIARLKAIHSSMGSLDGWTANGDHTFSEDVADLGGMHVAYEAWKASIKSSGVKPKPMIDGYTPDQRFFLAVARIWRSKWQGVGREIDPHGPPFARINGTLRNFPEFAKAFGCKDTDRMVLPANKRAEIW